MKNFHIVVTRQDINNGQMHNCSLCPVARAVRRAIKRPDVSVTHWICIGENAEGDYDIRANISRDVRAFIDLFDNGQYVAPFEFDLTFDADVEPWEEY